ncbi:MAG: HU family DNA-binding protein, partial [Muribaculaceae bacterium]|nr:HU family DNA-binding protein [Muribaculaceae bacterium]
MNKLIIFSQLSETIAKLTQIETADAESFVRELSVLVAERLESDGQVEVPGLGTFVLTDETVAFAPDAALAREINAPFAAFEAIELDEPLEPSEPSENSENSEHSENSDAEEIAAA